MLNSESLRLVKHLDGLAATEAPVADMARFAEQAAAAHAAAARPSMLSRTASLFGWLEGKAMSPITAALKKGAAVGLTPYAKDINILEGKKKSLNSWKYRLQSAKSTQLPKLLGLHDAQSDLFVQNITGELNAAMAALADAYTKTDKAQSTAQAAKNVLAQGKFPAQYTSIYLVQKNMAQTAFGRAQTQATNVYKNLQSFIQSKAKSSSPGVKGYAQAVGSTLYQGAGKFAGAAQWAGQEVEATAKEVAKGAESMSGLVKFWPIALGGLAVAYVLNALPKRSAQS